MNDLIKLMRSLDYEEEVIQYAKERLEKGNIGFELWLINQLHTMMIAEQIFLETMKRGRNNETKLTNKNNCRL